MVVSPRPAPPGSVAVTPSAGASHDGVDGDIRPRGDFGSRPWRPGIGRDGPVSPPPTRTRVRVAFLTPTLLMGGAERWMISLARSCDPRRIEWTGTALTEGAPADAELCHEMAAYMPVYAGPGAGPPEGSPSITRRHSARAALDAVLAGADVLVAWGTHDLARLVAGYSGPVVFVSHGSSDWTARAIRGSESGATHFVAVSEAALRPFSPAIRGRAVVIPNGVDVPRCTPTMARERVRAAWGFDERHRLVGYVGRYSIEKDPTAAARAVASLGGPYRAVYVGGGWMEAEVRRDVSRIAGGRARFVPAGRQVGDVLSALDVFMLTSPAEGFSLAMAEAWYGGLPVVATRVGAVPELERRHGPLVAPVPINPRPEELAGAVALALSPTFGAEVVPRAREAVCRHYTAGAMARRWTDYLGSVVGGEGAPWDARSSPSSPSPAAAAS